MDSSTGLAGSKCIPLPATQVQHEIYPKTAADIPRSGEIPEHFQGCPESTHVPIRRQ